MSLTVHLMHSASFPGYIFFSVWLCLLVYPGESPSGFLISCRPLCSFICVCFITIIITIAIVCFKLIDPNLSDL